MDRRGMLSLCESYNLHGLISVLVGNLIVMRVRDEAGADPEQGEGLDLQVGRLHRDLRLVQ